MNSLRGSGYGVTLDQVGNMLQVSGMVAEVLIGGWWVVTVEDCMTEKFDEGYLLELISCSRHSSMGDEFALNIDDTEDSLFVRTWGEAMIVLGMNLDYYRDKGPVIRVSTANASAPKPPALTQEEQDEIDMDRARDLCACTSVSNRWQRHIACKFFKEGKRISDRKKKVLQMFFHGRTS